MKTELKVKAASWGTFLAGLVGLTFLGTTATDYVHALPDWLEVPAYSLLGTAVTWVAGYTQRTRPANLSDSTIAAVQSWLATHAPRKP
jgi:hypothetical protein